MAPALTKFVKDGHGIPLSSPSSNDLSVYTMDLDSQLCPSEDLQKMLFSILPSLDSYLPPNPMDPPFNTGVATDQSGSVTLPSPDCLALSYNKSTETQQASFMLPSVSDMFFLPQHNIQEGCSHHNPKCHQCRPAAPSPNFSNVSLPFATGDSILTPTITSNQENCKFDQMVPRLELQNQIKERASRQTELQSRAQKLQRRLQALLGQHASLHFNQQLEGLWTHGGTLGGFSAGAEFSQVENEQHLPWLETSPDFTEIKEFGQFGHAVLKGLQEALDSEDTASSSSGDELLETKTSSEHRESVASPYFEERWLKERAELGSRWTWLQLRVTELDGRIQQLTKLHKNICSAKGSVVLADSKPMTDCQMKDALLREMVALSDADNEPCSPTRLLHNIERQSAQLSHIVNSLMPPLNLSPLSKPLQPWGNKRTFNSSKGKMFGVKRRQLVKDHMSCVCARTRPLVTYHKPRLFRLSSKCSSSLTGLTSCSCSHCSSSCDPVLLSSNMDNTSNDALSSRAYSSNGDSSEFSLFTKAPTREEWSQIPLVINALPLSPVHYRRHSSAPLYKYKKYKQHTQHCKNRVLGLSPIRQHGSFQRKHRVQQRKRKRQRRHSVTEDDDDVDSYFEDSSDEMFEENDVLDSLKHSSRGAAHRRYGESVFNIDNIVIPAFLTKVEKLQYKDILTPSWQVVDIETLMRNEDSEKDKDEKMETLSDEVFAQRHLPLEQKEKLRWSFWGKRRCRYSSRSGSRLSSCGAVFEENSALWSFTQLDTDEQLSTEECLPQAPWERRVFPLTEADEQALSSEVQRWCSTCTLSSLTSLNSDLIVSQSTDTVSPSYGHCMDCTNNEHFCGFENDFLSLKG